MDEIEVTALRTASLGINQEHIDSTTLRKYQTNNLAEVLDQHSGVYIKSYGLGSLATSSVRGAGAKQSIVLWNGLSVQNPMLGLLDLSLIPAMVAENIDFTKGGNASMWGSGVGGGIFAINNEIKNSKGFGLDLGLTAGSFDTYKGQARIAYANDKFSLAIKPFYHIAENDFEYNHINETRLQKHASLLNYGVLSELYLKVNNNNRFELRHWYQNTNRQIPASLTTANSQALQDDLISRFSFHWVYSKNNTVIKTRSAYFDEDNYFEDANISLEALNTFQSLINEVELSQKISNKQTALFGINHTRYIANAEAYAQKREENRVAVFLAFRQKLSKLAIEASLRLETQDFKITPLTPGISGNYQLTNDLFLKGRINRIYNLPTLNDRYWVPGGNLDLNPESGWNQEIGIEWSKSNFSFSSYFFNRNIKDQIIWTPGTNFWSPQNLNNANSNGIETSLTALFQLGVLKMNLRASYDYTRSVGENDKQLIYIPAHQANFGLDLNYKSMEFVYRHRFTGKVYTLTDHSSSLKAYDLGFVKMAYNLKIKNKESRLYLNVNNIFNKNYQVILSRPMPGIHLEAGFNTNL